MAGVSHQTVSRVVNDHPSVSDRTRARVVSAVAELGYRPNAAARSLATRRSRTIGVISIRPADFGPARMLLGLEAAARRAGYAVVVTLLQDLDAASIEEAAHHLGGQSVAGIGVIAPRDGADAVLGPIRSGVPLVQVGGTGASRRGAEEQVEAARAATAHLAGLGHRRIAHVAGPDDWPEARCRRDGWERELSAHGLLAADLWHGDWSVASGYEAGRLLAAAAHGSVGREPGAGVPVGPLTAVVAGNDQMALGIVRALVDAGLDVPRDVSVVGFDDIPEAAYLRPRLTTVRQDFDAIGERGWRVLAAAMRGQDQDFSPVGYRLVVRESASPPPETSRRGET